MRTESPTKYTGPVKNCLGDCTQELPQVLAAGGFRLKEPISGHSGQVVTIFAAVPSAGVFPRTRPELWSTGTPLGSIMLVVLCLLARNVPERTVT